MKLLLDENLSPKLVKVLSDIFPDTQHVEGCGMSASGDSEIWEFAKANEYAILSKD